MTGPDPDRLRSDILEGWERAAAGWERVADAEWQWAMPVAMWLIEHLALQPGQRLLELAAGPGEVGFLAAELIRPGGTLISSDGAEAMVAAARRRARARGLDGVEFRTLELEWIDLPAASVDAVLCRWGLMFALDPEAAARETRRVLRPGGRAAFAVWDAPERNPWMTIPRRALIELGHMEPPDPAVPGAFSLSAPDQLTGLLESAGFASVEGDAVALQRQYDDAGAFLAASVALSDAVRTRWDGLEEGEREQVAVRVAELCEPYRAPGGPIVLPARSLLAAGEA